MFFLVISTAVQEFAELACEHSCMVPLAWADPFLPQFTRVKASQVKTSSIMLYQASGMSRSSMEKEVGTSATS